MVVEQHPPGSREVLREHLPAVLTSAAAHEHGAPVDLATIHVSDDAQPTYQLGLAHIAEDGAAALDDAELVMWRFGVYDDHDVIGLALLLVDGPTPAFAGMSSGPSVTSALEAILWAAEALRSEPENYELRALNIPAVPFASIWLHGPRDLFVPIYEYPDYEMNKLTFYEWPDLVARIEARARYVHEHGSHELP